jgi:hypothetical protein
LSEQIDLPGAASATRRTGSDLLGYAPPSRQLEPLGSQLPTSGAHEGNDDEVQQLGPAVMVIGVDGLELGLLGLVWVG